MISGVAAETKLSFLIPKFFVYHSALSGMDFTVKTRWSRDLMVAAEVDIVLAVIKLCFTTREDLRIGFACLFTTNIGNVYLE